MKKVRFLVLGLLIVVLALSACTPQAAEEPVVEEPACGRTCR